MTSEEIEQAYSACMDSVNLINAGQPEGVSAEDWADMLARNKEHLQHMLTKDFWTDQDLSPIQAAAS